MLTGTDVTRMSATLDLQAIYQLEADFKSVKIRLCDVNGVKHGSVIDVISMMTEKSAQTVMVWKRMKLEHTDIEQSCNLIRFPQQAGRASPVANAETMLRIICLLRGAKAAEFRRLSARSFLLALKPSREFIGDLKERLEVLDDCEVGSFLVDGLKPVKLNQTFLYVRMCLPRDLQRTDITSRKQLTLSILKFGIAYSLRERNNQYHKEPDNAYMAFSFQCHNRGDAEVVENYMKNKLRDITVLGSREYVDAAQLAGLLDMNEYSCESYADYRQLAEKLFVDMVRFVKQTWAAEYPMFGQSHDVMRSCRSVFHEIVASGSAAEVPDVMLRYTIRDITVDMATAMGIVEKEVENEPVIKFGAIQSNDTVQRCVSIQRELSSDNRTHGNVISRDLMTGAEVTYANAEQAALSTGICASAMRRSFVNQASQLYGRHWRNAGTPFWNPPMGFVYDPSTYIACRTTPVRATSAAEVCVYESQAAACKVLRLTSPRNLSDYIRSGRVYLGFIWTEVLDTRTDYGTWSNKEVADPLPVPTPVVTEDTGANGSCHGKIIARNIATGQDITYKCLAKAAGSNGICAHALKGNLNQPRQVRGQVFRTFTATRVWTPPPYFRFNATTFEKKTNGFVISTSVNGGEKLMYESAKAAAELLNIKLWRVQQYINYGKVQCGVVWRSAVEADWNFWTQLPTPCVSAEVDDP